MTTFDPTDARLRPQRILRLSFAADSTRNAFRSGTKRTEGIRIPTDALRSFSNSQSARRNVGRRYRLHPLGFGGRPAKPSENGYTEARPVPRRTFGGKTSPISSGIRFASGRKRPFGRKSDTDETVERFPADATVRRTTRNTGPPPRRRRFESSGASTRPTGPRTGVPASRKSVPRNEASGPTPLRRNSGRTTRWSLFRGRSSLTRNFRSANGWRLRPVRTPSTRT